MGEPKRKRSVRRPRPPRWSKVAGRRSMSWSTINWMVEAVRSCEVHQWAAHHSMVSGDYISQIRTVLTVHLKYCTYTVSTVLQ
jgi:hypothetical protein